MKDTTPLPDQMLLTLAYLSQLHTFQYLGIEFGISESTAHNIFLYWLDIFIELLPVSLLEQVKKTKLPLVAARLDFPHVRAVNL